MTAGAARSRQREHHDPHIPHRASMRLRTIHATGESRLRIRAMRMLAGWMSMLSAWALCACATWFPAPVPMHKVEWLRPAAARARGLVVFLPGLGDDAEDFARNGFVGEVTKRGLSVDLVAAQATL